jgi:serine/threonine-protein kinase HipA
MNIDASPAHQPSDTLHLWWLQDPAHPALIGTLETVRTLRGVSLRYAPGWLSSGFALSEDLPLIDTTFLPSEKDTAAGAVDDARPDRWGERVIRLLDRPPRLSLMEFLYFAGDERFGALGVSTSSEHYQPRWQGPLPQWADVDRIDQTVQHVAAGEPVPEPMRRLVAPGVTMGGARPKALVSLDGQPWVLKFAEAGDAFDVPLVEHATLTLAAQAGIQVAETRPIPLAQRAHPHALAVRRFDREASAPGVRRCHALSARVALKAAGSPLGYPELAQLLRRRGVAHAGHHRAQMAELYRRMVFNILIDNTDDHEKNHVLLMNDRGELALSPAFDVVPSGQALGYQQMRVGADGSDATLANALSEHAQFGLDRRDAEAQMRRVARTVAGWKAHFVKAGVRDTDIDGLSVQIDRPFLADQRKAWAGAA